VPVEFRVPAIFWPTVGRLAGAGDGDAAGAAIDQIDGLQKGVVETIRHLFQGRGLVAQYLPGVRQPIDVMSPDQGIVNQQGHPYSLTFDRDSCHAAGPPADNIGRLYRWPQDLQSQATDRYRVISAFCWGQVNFCGKERNGGRWRGKEDRERAKAEAAGEFVQQVRLAACG